MSLQATKLLNPTIRAARSVETR